MSPEGQPLLDTLEEWALFSILNRYILCPEGMHHRKADEITMTDFTVIQDGLANFVPCSFHTER